MHKVVTAKHENARMNGKAENNEYDCHVVNCGYSMCYEKSFKRQRLAENDSFEFSELNDTQFLSNIRWLNMHIAQEFSQKKGEEDPFTAVTMTAVPKIAQKIDVKMESLPVLLLKCRDINALQKTKILVL